MRLVGFEIVRDSPSSILVFFLGSEAPLAAHVLLITTQQVLEPGRKKKQYSVSQRKIFAKLRGLCWETRYLGQRVPKWCKMAGWPTLSKITWMVQSGQKI